MYFGLLKFVYGKNSNTYRTLNRLIGSVPILDKIFQKYLMEYQRIEQRRKNDNRI